MNSTDPAIKEIFFEAIRLPPDEVNLYLDKTCGSNAVLRQRVATLLQAHDTAGNETQFSSSGSIKNRLFAKRAFDSIECPGDQIGEFRLIEQIGEGGFGVVFKAEQTQPFLRQVALKIVKIGMDTRLCLARFESERQTLALMKHPNIAAIYEGGMTENGRPYFVMELVEGKRITEYCVENKLSFDARLELFLQVCRAVEHTHQQGVLHRDIKPSNVMVVESEGNPLVKVIDFGLAKALDQTNFECSLTRSGDLIGTPMYMSPEQTGLSSSLDTRTDIYSLGMLLYETLTGHPPYDRQFFQTAPLESILKTVRESDPPRLSSHWSKDRSLNPLAGLPVSKPTPASEPAECNFALQQTQSERNALHGGFSMRRLRREFDWIVKKATEKNRENRYASIGALIVDIESFRENQPISAKPYSAAYVIGKFLSRNRAVAFSAASLLVALLVVTLVSTRAAWKMAEALTESKKAHAQAERDSQLALIHLAQAHTRGRQSGQRLDALDAVRGALKLPIENDERRQFLRNTASAALCLPDLRARPVLSRSSTPYDRSSVTVSRRLDLIGYLDSQTQQFVVREMKSQKEFMRLPEGQWSLSSFDYRGPNFSPDSKYLVYSKVMDGTPRIHVWCVGKPESGVDLGQHATSVSFAPDMQRCCVSHDDGTVRILRLPDFRELHRMVARDEWPHGDWSPGGDMLCIWGPKRVGVYETQNFHEVSHLDAEESRFEWHSWHPDNVTIATVLPNGKLFTWNSQTGNIDRILQTQDRRRGHLIAFSNCGRYLAMNNWQSLLTIFDYQTMIPTMSVQANGSLLQFSEDDSHLLANISSHEVCIYQFQPAVEVKTLARDSGQPFAPANISHAVDETNHWMAVNYDGGISVLDLRDGVVAWELPTWGSRPIRFGTQPYGLWTIGPAGLVFWPIEKNHADQIVRVGPPVRKLAGETIGYWGVDRAERVFAGCSLANGAVLVDPVSGEQRQLDGADIRFCTASSDGSFAASCTHSWPVEVKLWDVPNAKLITKATLPQTSQIAFLPDSRSLVTCGDGVQIRKLDEWEHPIQIGPESDGFVLSADGRLLVVGCEPNQVSLYDLESKSRLVQLMAPEPTRLWPLYLSAQRQRLYAYGKETGYLYEYDLAGIQEGLRKLGLAWQASTQSDSGVSRQAPSTCASSESTELDGERWRAQIEMGEYSSW